MARVVIEWEGLEEAIARLSEIGEKAPENVANLTKQFAGEAKDHWQEVTPQRTGRLRGADEAQVDGLTVMFNNDTRYYDWVSSGHWTPRGWRTRRGYRLAKRRSHVEGREMTEKLVEYIEQNLGETLSHFLDNV